LTADQRVALAVEDGAATLTTLLHRVKLAGHDTQAVLTDAITRWSLDDARQITNVLHRRFTNSSITLDPIGHSYTDWVPKVGDPHGVGSQSAATAPRRMANGRAAG
jgi:hypothetical protein